VVQIRRYGRSFVILLALMAVGTAAGFYILLQQRLANPFQSFYSINAAFPTAAAVAPGLGEAVNVAGVRVGEITGASLRGGLGIVHMEIDPHKLKSVYRDAYAELVPNTPLKDMEVNIAPGSPSAGVLPTGATISVAQTSSPIDSDELLDSLDVDTRTWLTSLIADIDQATSGRGRDIHALLAELGPTSAQLREIGDLLAARRQELAQIVHNFGVLTKATSTKDAQLETVIRQGDATVHAFATQNTALGSAISQLPPTLAAARSALTDSTALANALGPTATALLPTARRLPRTLKDVHTLFDAALLFPLPQIPAFMNAVVPLAGQLGPLERDLDASLPPLIAAFKVLAYVTNESVYNPGGKNPGFLYWFAWALHNADSFLSTGDAHGSAWRGLVTLSCSSVKGTAIGQATQLVLGTTFGC